MGLNGQIFPQSDFNMLSCSTCQKCQFICFYFWFIFTSMQFLLSQCIRSIKYMLNRTDFPLNLICLLNKMDSSGREFNILCLTESYFIKVTLPHPISPYPSKPIHLAVGKNVLRRLYSTSIGKKSK